MQGNTIIAMSLAFSGTNIPLFLEEMAMQPVLHHLQIILQQQTMSLL